MIYDFTVTKFVTKGKHGSRSREALSGLVTVGKSWKDISIFSLENLGAGN
jgi:hypothetical protein